MGKIKYLVMGIDNDEVGKLISNLIQGELQPESAEVLVSPSNTPQVYGIDSAGTVRRVDFDRFLSQVIINNRRRIPFQGSVEKLAQDAAAMLNGKYGTGSSSSSDPTIITNNLNSISDNDAIEGEGEGEGLGDDNPESKVVPVPIRRSSKRQKRA